MDLLRLLVSNFDDFGRSMDYSSWFCLGLRIESLLALCTSSMFLCLLDKLINFFFRMDKAVHPI